MSDSNVLDRGAIENWLVVGWADGLIHSVFDQIRLSGAAGFWIICLVSYFAHAAIVRWSGDISKILFSKAYLRIKSDEDRKTWRVSFVGFVHCIFDVAFVFYYIFDKNINGDKLTGFSPNLEVYLSISLGYYIYDMILCIRDFEEYGVMYLVHAVLGVFGLLIALSRQMQFYAIVFMMPETSSIFLNIRHMMKVSGNSHTLMYKINFILFFLSYFSIRMIYETFHSYKFIQTVLFDDVSRVFFPCALYFAMLGPMLTTLNIIWFKQIVKATYYTIFSPSKHQLPKREKTD